MSPLPSLSVLLVEDDPTNQLIALSMLRHLGIEADSANDGREGVQRVRDKRYDVILMDIQMPVMDGVEAMKRIRALELNPCPRIVAVTAHAVSGTQERLLAEGFDAFYNKPLTIALLHEALSIVADGSPKHSGTASSDSASSEVIDAVRAHVRDMLGEDDDEFVAELVSAFTESAAQALRDVANARSAGDRDGVARAAHSLKGSASNIGLVALTESWNRVEVGIRSGDADALGEMLDDAARETERTTETLESAPTVRA